MALPKITTPTYELLLPSTDKKLKFRPFLVKEEKILLIAMENNKEEEIFSAIKQIIKNCLFDSIDVETLPIFDLEYIFLHIRAKSVGEISKFRVLCPDDKKTYAHIEVDLTKIDVQVDDKHTNKIIIDDTKKLGLVLKYPSLSLFRNPSSISENPEEAFKLVVSCIDHIFEGEKIYPAKDSTEKELTSFLEDLTQKSFEKIKVFFDTMPKLKHEIEVENPKTKVKSKIVLQGLKDFFVSASPTST
jgi:hypothetical protein|tara:strand:+ start:892 stop:1626 length:735 start_codon:yes stop_codon:yes gene_type:complete